MQNLTEKLGGEEIHLQSDADGVMYPGNLLIGLAQKYLLHLLKERDVVNFSKKFLGFSVGYFKSKRNIEHAFAPFNGCPIHLVDTLEKKLSKRWERKVSNLKRRLGKERLNIRIISYNLKSILEHFVLGVEERLKKNGVFIKEIIGNELQIENGSYNGKLALNVSHNGKIEHVDPVIPYIGDRKERKIYRNVLQLV